LAKSKRSRDERSDIRELPRYINARQSSLQPFTGSSKFG
jgi:hypothetical protein